MIVKHLFLLNGLLGDREINGWRQYRTEIIFMPITGFIFSVRGKSSIQNNNFPVF